MTTARGVLGDGTVTEAAGAATFAALGTPRRLRATTEHVGLRVLIGTEMSQVWWVSEARWRSRHGPVAVLVTIRAVAVRHDSIDAVDALPFRLMTELVPHLLLLLGELGRVVEQVSEGLRSFAGFKLLSHELVDNCFAAKYIWHDTRLLLVHVSVVAALHGPVQTEVGLALRQQSIVLLQGTLILLEHLVIQERVVRLGIVFWYF